MGARKTLLVRARGITQVCNLEAQDAGALRYVGRRYDRETDTWPSTGEAVEVPARHEYRSDVAAGCLWAADEATAIECGVRFDPTFGGEVAAPAPAHKERK